MKLLILIMFLSLMTACERETKVELAVGNPPTFVLSGSGDLAAMTVYGPENQETQDPFDDTGALWKIIPEGGYEKGKPVERLLSITYGVVPGGYKQVIPTDNEPPLVLVPDVRYSYRVETTNAPHAGGFFQIKDGNAIPVQGPNSCFELRDGKWVRVECRK